MFSLSFCSCWPSDRAQSSAAQVLRTSSLVLILAMPVAAAACVQIASAWRFFWPCCRCPSSMKPRAHQQTAGKQADHVTTKMPVSLCSPISLTSYWHDVIKAVPCICKHCAASYAAWIFVKRRNDHRGCVTHCRALSPPVVHCHRAPL